jgi:hypothetical protein
MHGACNVLVGRAAKREIYEGALPKEFKERF